MIIISLDPGESTGYCVYDTEASCLIAAGTVVRDHVAIGALLDKHYPNVIVFETFNLYPGAAKSLVWNSFYPVEVIGIIKYWSLCHKCKLVNQSPGIKKFAGTLNLSYIEQAKSLGGTNTTEHTKDAILHLQYYLLKVRRARNGYDKKD